MSQTTISATLTRGFPGMLADNGLHDIVSKTSEESSAEIPFGVGVVQGTADDGALLPVDANSKFVGVALHQHNVEKNSTGEFGTTGFKPKATFAVMMKGRIIVRTEQAVAARDGAFLRHTVNGGDLKGQWRKDSDTNKAADVGGQARFLTATSGAGLTILEVDCTNKP